MNRYKKMTFKVFAYKMGSRSAKALADALGAKTLKHVGSKYKQRPEDLIINWGSGACPYKGANVANQPDIVVVASNKLTAFQRMKEANVSIPDFYVNAADIPAEAYPVMCRTILCGHSGRGIVVANNPDELVPAPLYTKYVKKQDEYRIHCLRKRGEDTSIISVQKKAKRREADNVNYKIRNLENGFVYIRDGIDPPAMVLEEAKKALEAVGLAFGAVDVIWNEKGRRAYVLEINTAPGLEGQTVQDYANAFKNL